MQAAEQQLPVSQQAQQQTRGLHKFVKQIVEMYGSGFTSRKMLLQQSLAGQDRSKGVSPSVISMQQNTRLAVLTLQVCFSLTGQGFALTNARFQSQLCCVCLERRPLSSVLVHQNTCCAFVHFRCAYFVSKVASFLSKRLTTRTCWCALFIVC